MPKEILVPSVIDSSLLEKTIDSNIYTPIKGNKSNLLKLVETNAKLSLENKFELIKKDEVKTIEANLELKNILGLDRLYRIDIYDNSNLFGEYYVSGMVVFKDGKPSKSDYRKFKISLNKNDDLSAMREVLYRRYYKVLLENLEKPDLIIVDGGENQINAAKEIINSLHLDIKVVGLKKDNKHSTSELINSDLTSIKIDKGSSLFHFLTRMQDEVHRFTITYHRQIRSKGSLSSILENVEGLGEKRRKDLIKEFGSINKIKEASVEEISKIVPNNIAIKLKEYLNSIG